MDQDDKNHISVHWFRHGLRLHDNPGLLHCIEDSKEVYPLYVLDEDESGISTSAYPRMLFLFETLQNLDENLREYGSRLYVLKGKPLDVLSQVFKEWGVTKLTFEHDPEPIYQDRDNSIKALCDDKNIDWFEFVSHTLWDPTRILEENGGEPPLTYAMFNQIAEIVGPPPRPVADPDFSQIPKTHDDHDDKYLLPSMESMGVGQELESQGSAYGRYLGGETKALKLLTARLEKESIAFSAGLCLPNQLNPNLTGMPMSLSPHLRFGSLSIRRFYWELRDLFHKMYPDRPVPGSITSQLIWREYFYCMSVNNPNYARMKENPICLDIDWYEDDESFDKWKQGQTGFPWIDACMRQLIQEGWIHQVCRHATACFLTRGDLWLDWQKGFKVFERYLIDSDWSVCAGNWMWVSSSAFEKVLQCPRCICPVRYGKRIDPTGEYVRKYVPELRNMPLEFLFEPWKAPVSVQQSANCIVGTDYPQPMVDHKQASRDCRARMEVIKKMYKDKPHIKPASEEEVLMMMWEKTGRDRENHEACNHEHGMDEACDHNN